MSYYYYYTQSDENYIAYNTYSYFNIRGYSRIKESSITGLKIEIYNESQCRDFDYFAKYVMRLQKITEVTIQINVKLQKEKNNPISRTKEVLDFLADTIIPKFKETIELITFFEVHIQEKNEKDEEQSTKKYIHRLLQPLENIKTISFRQSLREIKPSNFYALKSFVSLLNSNKQLIPTIKLLDFEFRSTEYTIKQKPQDQKEISSNMLQIAKDLSKINCLTELQIGIQNLGLEKQFFECLIESICKQQNLVKIGLDISENRINIESSVSILKKLSSLSNKIESLIFIDSQQFKPSALKSYSQIMKNFENLRFLQIEQMTFKKGQAKDFFECLTNMYVLEDIRFDLENSAMNEQDYQYFEKQLLQVKNLKSLYLTLPEEGQNLSLNTIQCIDKVLIEFKEQLTDLSFVFHSFIQFESSKQIVDSISNIENLKYLYIGFPNNRYHNNSFILDARKEDVKNIWSFKQVDCRFETYQYQNVIDFIQLLKYRALSNQDPIILEELFIYQYSFLKQNHLSEEINKEIQKTSKFKNIKNLINRSPIGNQEFITTNTILINNNQQSLEQITLSNVYNFQCAEMMKLIEPCNKLIKLDLNVDIITNDQLCTILDKYVLLQKIDIRQQFHFQQFPKIDFGILLKTAYLLEFNINNIQSVNLECKEILMDRRVYIQQYIIYSQLIQPYILFQPQLSHHDIVFD